MPFFGIKVNLLSNFPLNLTETHLLFKFSIKEFLPYFLTIFFIYVFNIYTCNDMQIARFKFCTLSLDFFFFTKV